MKRSRRQPEPERLEALARQAKDYALHMMRTTGSVPATVIADTDEGYVFCMPADLADEAAKDRFAEVARLLAVAQNARALVLVVEAWVKYANAAGELDTNIPLSQAADCKEVVALMLEDHSRAASSLLPILRDGSGTFLAFDSPLRSTTPSRPAASPGSCPASSPASGKPPPRRPRCWPWA